MIKKIFVSIALLLFLFPTLAKAETAVNAYLFFGDGCPHCAKEKAFLHNTLEDKYPSLKIYEYEVYYSRDNQALMQKVGKFLNADVGGVPFLVISDEYFVGYAEGVTSVEIENKVKDCLKNSCPDPVASILGIEADSGEPNIIDAPNINDPQQIEVGDKAKVIKVPFFGEINASKLSLPVLTIVLGVLDGFNPCAMWALLFLISLLLGMKDRKRMWILGTTFIVASAFVYFVFMSAWLNLILFLGLVVWVRALIGILALFGGGYSLREFMVNKENVCKVTGGESRQKVFEKLKSIINQNSFWLALGGIIVLAFMVNLVELICSAGLPAVYTQVLAMSNLSSWQYYSYILLYIFFFMIDDLFVFFVAMITLRMTGITTKYSRWSHLIGGILMLIIGLLLILRPEWLMFG